MQMVSSLGSAGSGGAVGAAVGGAVAAGMGVVNAGVGEAAVVSTTGGVGAMVEGGGSCRQPAAIPTSQNKATNNRFRCGSIVSLFLKQVAHYRTIVGVIPMAVDGG